MKVKAKPTLEAIAKSNMSDGGKGVPIGTLLGRINDEIGKRAKVSSVLNNTLERVNKEIGKRTKVSSDKYLSLDDKGVKIDTSVRNLTQVGRVNEKPVNYHRLKYKERKKG